MLVVLLSLACGTNEAPTAAPAPAVPAPAASAPAAEVDVAATLAKADAHDGAVDQVVQDCPVCALAMKGDPANAFQHEGYELHFCSERCQKGFAADPATGVARLATMTK